MDFRTFVVVFFMTFSSLHALPCEIVGGRSELILDVTESRGEDFSQPISPEELPIDGVPGEDFTLELSEDGQRRFTLTGKSLRLLKPLDRDDGKLSTLRFEISCRVRSTSSVRSIPVVLRVRDLNDNPPEFIGAPYHVAVQENAVIGTPIFNGIKAQDKDAGRNAQVEYQIIGITPQGAYPEPQFSIRFPHQGAVFLMKPLDYETTALYQLEILAADNAEDPSDRLNSTTTLTIMVKDIDDQNPIFDTAATPNQCPNPNDQPLQSNCTKEYYSSIVEGTVAGVLDVYPGRIHAKDPDSLGAPVRYSFVSGSPGNFKDFFAIDPRSAVVKQVAKVDRNYIKKFDIIIQATELSPRRGFTRVRLMINVEKVDTSPPKLIIPGYKGKVPEASIRGTPVLLDDGSNLPFAISVYDPDINHDEQTPLYAFELTTSAFEVNGEGVLVVADPDLDRDPPNLPQYTFQLIARERREGGTASAPVTLTVRLLDVNDNVPRLPVLPTITFPAGAERRELIQLKATDIDEGENAVVRYSLDGGSRGKFILNSKTGVLTSTGDLVPGEKFFLNVKATDKGNLTGEGFVEVVVSRGQNTNGPIFSQSIYFATVPEDIPYGERIIRVQARDPEEDSSYYSITNGNDEGFFEMDTLSGIITVVAPLDREKKSDYTLEVMAEDSEGKNNKAVVEIRVTDVNDVSPFFLGEPYSFRVNEGIPNATVGRVQANDTDLGVFGKVKYSLEEPLSNFKIGSISGQLSTNVSLDYEKQKVHYISVIAQDEAKDPRSSTSTVTVLVNDVSDENPFFEEPLHVVHVPENAVIGSLITTVKAIDKDSIPLITYKLIEGDSTLFTLSPNSGEIFLLKNLDYENKTEHFLTIGTLENDEETKLAKITVQIEIEDINDESPIIDDIHTVTLAKKAPFNTLVTKVSASDRDSTYPNNEIEYSIITEDVVGNSYFKIDPKSGEIRLMRQLTEVEEPELKVKVKVTDGGTPPLSSTVEFRILLLQNVFGSFPDFTNNFSSNGKDNQITSLASSPQFSKDHMVLYVNENIPSGSVIAKVPIVNTTSSSVSCTVLEGNEEGTFKTKVSEEGNCKIISSKNLDFEERSLYNLSLALHPQEFVVKGSEDVSVLSKAIVEINVKDSNDNSPVFVLNGFEILEDYPQTTVLSFVIQDSQIGTKIAQIKAMDLDSGTRGDILFHLVPESNRGNYFSISRDDGILRTQRRLFNVPLELQPFNLTVVATDSPGDIANGRSSTMSVILPVIEDGDRIVLSFNSSLDEVEPKLDNIRQSLSSITGKYVQLEKLTRSRLKSRGKSNLWFHLLEPNTWQTSSPGKLYEDEEVVVNQLSSSLQGIPVNQLMSSAHLNLIMEKEKNKKNLVEEEVIESVSVANINLNFTVLEYAMIGLAGLIILFVLSSLIAVCLLWSRFSKKWNSADKTVMLIPPTITRPSSVMDSVSKEYEVQVLHMSVPMDDESVQETNVGSSSSRQAYLDNVSYISKSRNNLDCSSSGGSSGMVTPEILGNSPNNWSPPTKGGFRNSEACFSGSHMNGPDIFNGSATNDNVMFGRKSFVDQSETTTEL